MDRYEAKITWNRSGASFSGNSYSRAHAWSFDGGIEVPASASPSVVPAPYSVAEAVDPEEALVAAAASCHMLWFLSIASKRGFIVESYTDEAFGILSKNQDGKMAITRITLRPKIEFSGARLPTREELDALHHAAHEECFIASSLKAEILVE